jgi:hypothetical protein
MADKVWLAVWVVLALVWFPLLLWFFRRLRTRHPSTYETIGSPSLFWNNSIANNWLLIKFVFGSEWQKLDDPMLARVCLVMRVFLGAFILLFFGFSLLFLFLLIVR